MCEILFLPRESGALPGASPRVAEPGPHRVLFSGLHTVSTLGQVVIGRILVFSSFSSFHHQNCFTG